MIAVSTQLHNDLYNSTTIHLKALSNWICYGHLLLQCKKNIVSRDCQLQACPARIVYSITSRAARQGKCREVCLVGTTA